jgi:hypothetical protein
VTSTGEGDTEISESIFRATGLGEVLYSYSTVQGCRECADRLITYSYCNYRRYAFPPCLLVQYECESTEYLSVRFLCLSADTESLSFHFPCYDDTKNPFLRFSPIDSIYCMYCLIPAVHSARLAFCPLAPTVSSRMSRLHRADGPPYAQ